MISVINFVTFLCTFLLQVNGRNGALVPSHAMKEFERETRETELVNHVTQHSKHRPVTQNRVAVGVAILKTQNLDNLPFIQ